MGHPWVRAATIPKSTAGVFVEVFCLHAENHIMLEGRGP